MEAMNRKKRPFISISMPVPDRRNDNASSTEMLSCYLPGDLVAKILLRLPVKSLLRFMSVSKSWYAFLKTPNFVKMHSLRINADFPGLALNYHRYTSCVKDISILQLDSTRGIAEFSEMPLPVSNVRFVCSCNALVCLDLDSGSELCLWNPSTRNYRKITVPDCYTYLNALLKLGYIQERNDYMILKMPLPGWGNQGPNHVWIYTFSLDSWRCIKANIPWVSPNNTQSTVSLNGVVHWVADLFTARIIAFDMTNYVFNSMATPDSRSYSLRNAEHRPILRDLMLLEGCLSIIAYPCRYNGYSPSCYEIWVMTEYGIEESWTKKFSIGPFYSITVPLRIVQIGNTNKLVFIEYERVFYDYEEIVLKNPEDPCPSGLKLFSYDLISKNITYFKCPRQLQVRRISMDFVESL